MRKKAKKNTKNARICIGAQKNTKKTQKTRKNTKNPYVKPSIPEGSKKWVLQECSSFNGTIFVKNAKNVKKSLKNAFFRVFSCFLAIFGSFFHVFFTFFVLFFITFSASSSLLLNKLPLVPLHCFVTYYIVVIDCFVAHFWTPCQRPCFGPLGRGPRNLNLISCTLYI
jgi:hypothetical protein